jgi:ABC-type nitrate/sulfonate/bicarbonate transport system permease component
MILFIRSLILNGSLRKDLTMTKILKGAVGLTVLVIIWHIAATRYDSVLFPAPYEVIKSLFGMFTEGEMVGAQSGLGFLIIDSRNNIRPDLLLAAILTIGIIGLLLDILINLFEKRIYTKWGVVQQ